MYQITIENVYFSLELKKRNSTNGLFFGIRPVIGSAEWFDVIRNSCWNGWIIQSLNIQNRFVNFLYLKKFKFSQPFLNEEEKKPYGKSCPFWAQLVVIFGSFLWLKTNVKNKMWCVNSLLYSGWQKNFSHSLSLSQLELFSVKLSAVK